jgi:hypothetical protein
MKPLIFPISLLLAFAATPLLASEEHAGKDPHACPMHDDSLSAEERAQAMDKMFAKLDADSDGRITREEFAAHHEGMGRKRDDKQAQEHEH